MGMVQKLTRRPEQRRAGVAARDRDHRRHHQVLDEGARDDDLDRVPLLGVLNRVGDGLGVNASIGIIDVGERRLRNARLRVLLLEVRLVAKEAAVERALLVFHAVHGRIERLAHGDVHVLVHLLVVDDDVHVLAGEVLGGTGLLLEGLGRGHAVELADLGGALQHLDRVGVVVDLVLRAAKQRTGRGEHDDWARWEDNGRRRAWQAGAPASTRTRPGRGRRGPRSRRRPPRSAPGRPGRRCRS